MGGPGLIRGNKVLLKKKGFSEYLQTTKNHSNLEIVFNKTSFSITQVLVTYENLIIIGMLIWYAHGKCKGWQFEKRCCIAHFINLISLLNPGITITTK